MLLYRGIASSNSRLTKPFVYKAYNNYYPISYISNITCLVKANDINPIYEYAHSRTPFSSWLGLFLLEDTASNSYIVEYKNTRYLISANSIIDPNNNVLLLTVTDNLKHFYNTSELTVLYDESIDTSLLNRFCKNINKKILTNQVCFKKVEQGYLNNFKAYPKLKSPKTLNEIKEYKNELKAYAFR